MTREKLKVAPEEFLPCDLDKSLPSVERFGLAISTEFVEHVENYRSAAFVDFLTSSADYVLFSAAIPGQPGLGHI